MTTLQYLSNYYGEYDEDSRFNSKHGSVEFLTTMRYINKYLKLEPVQDDTVMLLHD